MRIEFSGVISIRKRILLMLSFMVILYIILFLGSMSTLTEVEIQQIMDKVEELLRDISAWKIFLNNFQISLIMLVPLLGTVLGGFIIYSTGMVFAAYSQQFGLSSIELVLFTILSPYGLLEFIGYGLATSEGIVLIYSLIKRKFRKELPSLLIIVIFIAGVLLIAAAIEMLFIETFATI